MLLKDRSYKRATEKGRTTSKVVRSMLPPENFKGSV